MVTKLYLIRHGETEGGQLNRYKGHIDVPLSDNGIRQMERLSKYIVQNRSKSFKMVQSSSNLNNVEPLNNIEQLKLNAVYCSDLSRALKSAEIIAKPHKLRPIVMPELRERNFGIWEGMTFNEIKEKYTQEFDAWVSNPLKFSPMQGESTIEVRDRVLNALNKILDNHSNIVQSSSRVVQNSSKLNNIEQSSTTLNNIVVVSHGGVNRIILCHLLGIPFENIFRIEQDYGALNIVEIHDKYPMVKLLNYIIQTV